MRDKNGRFVKGHKQTEEWKKQKSEEMIGNKHWDNPICKSNQFKKGHKSTVGYGKDNGNYKNGLSRGSRVWKEWRGAVLERDNYTCQKCGTQQKQLQAHHIKDKIKYPKLKFEVSNGISLCRKCHFYKHFKKI